MPSVEEEGGHKRQARWSCAPLSLFHLFSPHGTCSEAVHQCPVAQRLQLLARAVS